MQNSYLSAKHRNLKGYIYIDFVVNNRRAWKKHIVFSLLGKGVAWDLFGLFDYLHVNFAGRRSCLRKWQVSAVFKQESVPIQC